MNTHPHLPTHPRFLMSTPESSKSHWLPLDINCQKDEKKITLVSFVLAAATTYTNLLYWYIVDFEKP